MFEVQAYAYNPDGLPIISVAENLNAQALSTPLGAGTVAVSSTTTGSGFLMYSVQDVQTRFGACGSSGSLIAVACVGGQWQYDNGTGLVPFNPLPTDVLVASVDFDTFSSPTSLFNTDTTFQGIEEGYGAGTGTDSLSFSGNAAQQTFTVASTSASFVQNLANRVTLLGYDWRDRPLWTMVDDLTPDPNNPGSTRKTYTFHTCDNLGEVTDVTRYYDLANTSGLPDNAPNAGDPVIGRSGAAYDSVGQVYQTSSYNQPGTVAIVANTWRDADGNVIKSQAGGTQEFTKTAFDGLDRPTAVYVGCDATPEPIGTSGQGDCANLGNLL